MFAKKADGYHSIAVIPDTQTLSALRPESFTKLTTWIKDNAETLGIELAVHVGDIVDSNGNQKQWDAAKTSLHVLDGEVPYVFSPGNHDSAFSIVDGVSKRDSSMFNKNFPYAKYATNETFGGAFEVGKMDNTYSFFAIGGVPFMSIALETSPRDEVLAWANALIEKHADRKVFISTHNYLHLDGTRTTEQTQDHHAFYDNTGEDMWNQMIKKHQNIVFVVSGHIGYPDVVMSEDVGIHGNVVKQILCDAQFADRENISKFQGDGLGMIMLLSFKEGSDDIQVNWYSTVREEFFRVRNQFTTSMPITNDQDIQLAKDILRNAMAKVEAISDEEMAKLAPKIQTMLSNAYEEACLVMENATATQKQYVQAWFNLANALHYANFVADKTELNAFIRICSELKEEDYSAGFDVLKDALDNARAVSEDQNALQASIDVAFTSLLNAYQALVKDNDSARETLMDMIAIFDTLDESIYCNNDAWKLFVHALQDAKAILTDENATALQLHTATRTLANAYEDIRLLPNEAILKDVFNFLEQLESLDLHDYTASESAKIMAVVAKARMMLQDPNTYNPAILDEIITIKALIENKSTTAFFTPANKHPNIQNDTNEHITTPATNTNGIPKTGDTTYYVTTMALTLISGASLYLLNKKRKTKA